MTVIVTQNVNNVISAPNTTAVNAGQNLTVGVRGLSAYQIAVQEGFSGTEAEWLESLKGEDGGVSDHGDLTGLNGDDHQQYHNDARGDVRYYTKAQVDASLAGKANSSHGHVIADVAGLQTALDSKGDVAGPALATDKAISRFSGTGGKVLQNSDVIISDANELQLPQVTTPTAAATDTTKIFSRKIANKGMLAVIGPSGLDSSLQPLIARNKIAFWNPSGNATTVPVAFGFAAFTITGFTATARNVATTNLFTRLKRMGYVSAATTGAVGHFRQLANQFSLGDGAGLGGFFYVIRFGISDAAAVAGARMFMGLAVTSVPTNVEPSTLTSCIGVGHGASDTNMRIYYGGSSAQTPIDLGVDFPSNTQNVDAYELALFSSPNVANTVHYEVTRLNTGHTASGMITGNATVIPQSSTLIAPWGYRTNNATALAVGLDVAGVYMETDF